MEDDKTKDLNKKSEEIPSGGANRGGRNASSEGPKTWASAPERPEKEY